MAILPTPIKMMNPVPSTKNKVVGLRAISLNINSLMRKVQSVLNLLTKYDLDVLFIQETFCYNVNFLKVPGYDVYHLSPSDEGDQGRAFHGVCLIVRESLHAERIGPYTCPPGTDQETFARFLAVEIPNLETALVNAYLPSVRNDLTSDENNQKYDSALAYLENLTENHTNVILAGDMNVDPIRDVNQTRLQIFNHSLGNYHALDKKLIEEDLNLCTFVSYMNGATTGGTELFGIG